MKKKILRLLYITVAIATVFVSVPLSKTLALGNTLLFSAPPSSMNIGATFTVSVRAYVEAAASTGQVAGTVIYQPNLVKVIATSPSGSTYGTPAIVVGSSTVGFSGSTTPGPSGLTNVFSITFQAIGAGSANLSFSGDSTINGAPATRNNASFTINNPNPTPTPVTPKPKPTPPAPVTPTVPPVPTPPPAPVATPPTATEVEENTAEDTSGVIEDPTTSSSYDKATVSWRHSKEQASTTLIFGATRTSMTNKAEIVRQSDGSYTATLLGLTPGVRYYYSITSLDAAKKASTWDSVVIAKGYPVILAITESDQVAANAVVRIGSISRTAGKDGNASVELAAGKYSATITTENKVTKTVSFTVVSKTVPTDGKAPESQKYSFNLEGEKSSSGEGGTSILTFLLVLFGGGAVLVMGVLGYLAYRRRQYEGGYADTSYAATGPSVVIDDGYNWQQQTPSAPLPPPPPPPVASGQPNVGSGDYEEPKDMFELAREREARLEAAEPQQPPKQP